MIVNYYKMSGEELKRIYDISQMNGDDFAARLGIKRHQLYTQFAKGTRSIDTELEKKLKSDPELSRNQQLLSIDLNGNVQGQNSSGSPSVELWSKALDMLNETIQLLADNNKFIQQTSVFIQKDAEIYRNIVEAGFKEGAISFNKVGKKT